MKLLKTYHERYETSRPQHPVLLEAAGDSRLQTGDLVHLAISHIEKDGAGEQPNASFALLVLQQRVTPEVLQTAYDLLQEHRPAARHLGASILREFPRLDLAPYPHSVEAIGKLEQMLARETDLDVLARGLSAIGWQRHPLGLAILLRYRHHEQDYIRDVVAKNITCCCPNEAPLPADATRALLAFSRDPDPEIRWSVFWDIAEYPELFQEWRAEFLPAVERGTSDAHQQVRETAERALQRLHEPSSRP